MTNQAAGQYGFFTRAGLILIIFKREGDALNNIGDDLLGGFAFGCVSCRLLVATAAPGGSDLLYIQLIGRGPQAEPVLGLAWGLVRFGFSGTSKAGINDSSYLYAIDGAQVVDQSFRCLLYTSPSP